MAITILHHERVTSNLAVRAIILVSAPLWCNGPLACGASKEPREGTYAGAVAARSRRFLSLFLFLNCCSLSWMKFCDKQKVETATKTPELILPSNFDEHGVLSHDDTNWYQQLTCLDLKISSSTSPSLLSIICALSMCTVPESVRYLKKIISGNNNFSTAYQLIFPVNKTFPLTPNKN